MSDHYYDRQGNPCYEVPCKSRPGEMRPSTLADAKKLGLFPSVTTVLGVLDKSGLVEYKIRQVLESALTLPSKPGEDLTDYSKRVRYDAEEHARQAANKGTYIHNQIENYFLGRRGGFTSEVFKIIDAVTLKMLELKLDPIGGDWVAEKTFCSPLGFGGKVDLHSPVAVVDFKTKGNWKKNQTLGYDEHAMQLAAYDVGLSGANTDLDGESLITENEANFFGFVPRRHVNIFISTEEPGKVEAVEWKEPEFHWKMFSHCLELWKMVKRFES